MQIFKYKYPELFGVIHKLFWQCEMKKGLKIGKEIKTNKQTIKRNQL